MKSAVFSFIFLFSAANGSSLRARDSQVEPEPHDGDEWPLSPQPRRLSLKNGDVIPGSYIVTLKNDSEPDGRSRRKHGHYPPMLKCRLTS
jgi:hypothetical protein